MNSQNIKNDNIICNDKFKAEIKIGSKFNKLVFGSLDTHIR